MASSLVLPALLLAASLAGPAAAESLSDSPGQYRVYLQRGADGRAMLTDRPSADAVTERSWQLEREDRAAAQQRALEVRRESEAVSERIQRSIEAQARRASEADLLRLQMARLDRAADEASNASDDAVAIVAPGVFGRFANRRAAAFDMHRPRRAPHPVMRPMSFRGPIGLGGR
jgi:hypothetical protein